MHAFLWRKGVMTDLGSLDRIPFSTALSINSSGQIVGNVGDALYATLSEDGGPMVDLNTLIPANPGLVLWNALYINDRGEIAAQGTLSNGDVHSFVLIPCDENHPGVAGCDYDLIDAETAAAHVSLDPTQHPKALTPGTRMPGMLNRLRSPKGRPAPGRAPAAVASLAISATPATADWLADRPLVPGSIAYCEISNGALTGACVQTAAFNQCQITSNGCPSGMPASGSVQRTCGNNTVYLSAIRCFSVAGFDLSAAALTPATISPGKSASSTVTVSGYGSFGGTVVFTCSVQPFPLLAPTCSISPSSVKSGTTTLTVSTSAPTGALLHGTDTGVRYALWLPLFGLLATAVGFGSKQKNRKAKIATAALSCMLFAGLVLQFACGSGSSSNPGTPTGAYTVTVTGQSGAVVSSTTAMLTVQ
jgi:hypothetical protein